MKKWGCSMAIGAYFIIAFLFAVVSGGSPLPALFWPMIIVIVVIWWLDPPKSD